MTSLAGTIIQEITDHTIQFRCIVLARDNMQSELYAIAPVRLSVRTSVSHTAESVKNGWS